MTVATLTEFMLKVRQLLSIRLHGRNHMAANHSYSTGPEILEMPSQKMAAVYAKGTPEQVFPRVLPDLYGSVYSLNVELEKQGLSTFTVGRLRARYPDAHLVPTTEWTNVIGLPIPENTLSLPQKVGGNEIKIEVWEYGTVGQILVSGREDSEITAIERLHRYIRENNYKIIGVHEEEHLAQPNDDRLGVLVRYRISKKKHK